jgi:hypothetical protein
MASWEKRINSNKDRDHCTTVTGALSNFASGSASITQLISSDKTVLQTQEASFFSYGSDAR